MAYHMPTYGDAGSGCSSGECDGGGRIVTYTAVGDEDQAGFPVPIGATLATADYNVGFFGAVGDISIPAVWTFYDDEQTTSQLWVGFAGGSLTPGGVYKFQIVES